MPITGQPILAARSITLHIFSAITSPSEPPNTVKSCEKTATGRPSIVPCPVTTASPPGARCRGPQPGSVAAHERLLVRRAEVVEQPFEALLEVVVRGRAGAAPAQPAPEAGVGHLLLDPGGERDLRAPARGLEPREP